MADTSELRARAQHVRIDSQTTLSLALVLMLIGGGVQYGRQSERLDRVERELSKVTEKLDKLTEALTANGYRGLSTGR
jgi:hypothetical protein